MSYYADGRPEEREFYLNRKLSGIHKFWLENGYLSECEFYRDGELIDAKFTFLKKRRLLRVIKYYRKRTINLTNTMLISDLVDVISRL